MYLTSDLHFGHENIIKYCSRPYSSAKEMDEDIVSIWNNTVPSNGTVYVLGDIVWYKTPEEIISVIKRLNGKIKLIPGNHDTKTVLKACSTLKNVEILDRLVALKHDKIRYELCHYPIESWPGNIIHLHGHAHGKSITKYGRMDVGWDVHSKLLHIDDILPTMKCNGCL